MAAIDSVSLHHHKAWQHVIQNLGKNFDFAYNQSHSIPELIQRGATPEEGEIIRKRKRVGNRRGKMVTENTKLTDVCCTLFEFE